MLDLALKKLNLSVRITVKATISVLLVVLAVALPQLTHAVGGAQAGTLYMPMYMPALLAGLILGWKWGLAVGLLSPVASYGFTTFVFGTAMPNTTRLPYMILELGVYGLVSGLFSKRVQKSPVLAFPAVLSAQFAGRTVYLVYNLIAGRSFSSLWAGMASSMLGLWLQAILVPVIAIVLFMVIKHEQKTE